MTIQHVDVTDPNIHEPKGITTAASGEIYVANGSGGGSWQAQATAPQLSKRVIVTQASDLAGPLDSTVEYFIDGVIDMGNQAITVPDTGLTLAGYSLEKSGLTSSEASYSMFVSPSATATDASGNLFIKDLFLTTSDATSEVFNLLADSDLSPGPAIELTRVNFDNCGSLGTIDGYRQGLELGTGRFLGSPSLVLKGTWSGGYRCTTSIARVMFGLTSDHLFVAHPNLVMTSRFLTDINADFPTGTGGLLDLSGVTVSTAFPNPSTVQLQGAILTRNGARSPGDPDFVKGISETDLASFWKNNLGIGNTYEGGKLVISSSAATTVSLANTSYTIAGTYTASDLVHFTQPSNEQLRHEGDDPREYRYHVNAQLLGTAADILKIEVNKYDASAASSSVIATQTREVFNFTGGSDSAFFDLIGFTNLDDQDYLYLTIQNTTAGRNVTMEIDSSLIVEAR
jgi:hypothetical protein